MSAPTVDTLLHDLEALRQDLATRSRRLRILGVILLIAGLVLLVVGIVVIASPSGPAHAPDGRTIVSAMSQTVSAPR